MFSGRYRDISGFSFAANCHFYFSPYHFRLLPRLFTERFRQKRRRPRATSLLTIRPTEEIFTSRTKMPCLRSTNYHCICRQAKLTCIDKFIYMPAYLASSLIILYACMHMPYYPEALSHCGYGHGLTSVARLYVVNIADIRSAFIETLASERFRRNAVDGAP